MSTTDPESEPNESQSLSLGERKIYNVEKSFHTLLDEVTGIRIV